MQDKDRLGGGFVDAGKGPTSIERFELGRRHDSILAVHVLVGGSIKPRHLVVQESGIFNGQYHAFGILGNGRGKDKLDRVGLDVDSRLLGRHLATLVVQRVRGRNKGQFLGVKRNGFGPFFIRQLIFVNRKGNDALSLEGKRLQVRFQR